MTRFYFIEQYIVRMIAAENDEQAVALQYMKESVPVYATREPVDWVEVETPMDAQEQYFTTSRYPGSHLLEKATKLLDVIPPHGPYCQWLRDKSPCNCGVDQYLDRLTERLDQYHKRRVDGL